MKRILSARAPVAAFLLMATAGCIPLAQEKTMTDSEKMPPTVLPQEEKMMTLSRTVDLNIGETAAVTLSDNSQATVVLRSISVKRDTIRSAVRAVEVSVEVNGTPAVILSALYTLPATVGGVQIDCPVVKAYLASSRENPWAIEKDARLRLWPAGSPWIQPGSFAYPVRQRWFASDTQMANEPVFVDGPEGTGRQNIYYHNGLDIGGAEGLVEVVSATDGVVITAGKDVWKDAPAGPKQPRYDKVMILDGRGWYHAYYHLQSVDPSVRVGEKVKMGQVIGILGKEGDSGGWSHLHYGITAMQPSGRWGTEEGYAFLWQAAVAEQSPKVIAVARPHHLLAAGETAALEGGKSWSASGGTLSYEWTFTDGTRAAGHTVSRRYDRPGEYSEILRVTDGQGNTAVDFAVVQVLDPTGPAPPAIHLAHHPTTGVKPNTPVTFKVRTFGAVSGRETIDYGDGSPPDILASDGCANPLAKAGYAVTTHRFAAPGQYIVTARRTNEHGFEAMMRTCVRVEP